MSALLQPIVSLANMIVGLINGLIIGLVTFVYNFLDGLDHFDVLLDHAFSAVSDFFASFITLGSTLFPFLPDGWLPIIQTVLIILVIGLILKRKVLS